MTTKPAMQRMRPDELQDTTRFVLRAEFTHQEIAQFAQEYFWQHRSWITWAINALLLLNLAALFWLARQQGYSFGRALTLWGWAMLATFLLLLPVHEAIHALVYWWEGCRDIQWSYSLRSFAVYVTANQFVVNAREFFWVAVMPFLVVSCVLLTLAALVPAWRFFLLSMLLAHTAASSGDWALINYFWLRRGEQVYTFDDVPAGKSYFYARTTAAGR